MQADNEHTPDCPHPLEETRSLAFAKEYRTIVGVHPHERTQSQVLSINMTILFDNKPVNKRDLLVMINALIADYLNKESPLLLERVALSLGIQMKSSLPPFCSLQLTVKKPGALKDAQHASVTIAIEGDLRCLEPV